VTRIILKRDDETVLGQRSRQPDRAAGAERPDFEDPFGADHSGDEVQELALGRRNVDPRKTASLVPGKRLDQNRIGERQLLDEVAIDG